MSVTEINKLKADMDNTKLSLSSLQTDFDMNAKKVCDNLGVFDFKIEELDKTKVNYASLSELMDRQDKGFRDLKTL
jgi:hypothetical protein